METIYLAIVRVQVVGDAPIDEVRGLIECALDSMHTVANVKVVSLAEDLHFPKFNMEDTNG